MTLTFIFTHLIRYSESTSLSKSINKSTDISDFRLIKSEMSVKFSRNLPNRWTRLATSRSDNGSLNEYLISESRDSLSLSVG